MIPEGGIRSTKLWQSSFVRRQEYPVADAMNYVAGFCTSNDVSERVFQLSVAQWTEKRLTR